MAWHYSIEIRSISVTVKLFKNDDFIRLNVLEYFDRIKKVVILINRSFIQMRMRLQ